MEPYNVKAITYPDLSRQYRVYYRDVVYKGCYREYRFKNPFDDNWTKTIKGDIQKHYEHTSEVSMKRTKSKVYNYARCNDWEWFVTFTFSPDKVNRYDYDVCIRKLKMWLDYVRRSSPALSYLVVPEKHKDGAYHFHRLLVVWRSRFKRTDEKIYRFGSYKLGWMTATRVKEQALLVVQKLADNFGRGVSQGRHCPFRSLR